MENRILILTCIISNLSYYPFFQQTSFARYVVIGIWGLVLLWSIVSKRVVPFCGDGFKLEILVYFGFIVCSLITLLFGGTKVFSNHFFSVVSIAMMILFVGYMNGEQIGRDGLNSICLYYMHVMFIISVPLFIFYLKDTDLSSLYYSYQYGKNAIAILLLSAFLFGMVLFSPRSTIAKLYRLGGMGVCLLDLIFLRCRTALLCVVVCLFLIVLLGKIVDRRIKIAVIVAGVIVFLFSVNNVSQSSAFINNVIFAGRNSNSIDSLSSGRLNQILQGLDVFYENLFTGVGSRETLDCMFVSVLANYGIGAWSIILLAMTPLFWAIKNVKSGDKVDLAFFLVAVSMIITAFFEELAPFGSGTRCYILWLMWGILMRSDLKLSREEE